jgi:hypothetical protein
MDMEKSVKWLLLPAKAIAFIGLVVSVVGVFGVQALPEDSQAYASLHPVWEGKAWTIALFGGLLLMAMMLEKGVLAVFRAISRGRPKE